MNDLISRQAAIDALKNRWKKTRNYEGIGDDIAEECEIYLKTLPSAQPVRHGKWMVTPVYIKCSECGESFMLIPQNYCPYCGAKMDAERKEE